MFRCHKIAAACLLLTSLGLVGCEQAVTLPSPFKASDVSSQLSVADFELSDQFGQPRRLSEFRGKVVAVFFGYTHCPDVCPTTLADLTQVQQQLGKESERLQVLFITVDPARDDAARLKDYLSAFGDGFLALRTDEASTAAVAAQFGVSYQQQELEDGYYVDHTLGTFLIDPQGRVRLHVPHAQRGDWLLADIRLLLQGV